MVNNPIEDLGKFQGYLKDAETKFKKTLDQLQGADSFGKINNMIKQFDVDKEKKGLINKKKATIQLFKDKSIKIIFDNIADAEEFFKK